MDKEYDELTKDQKSIFVSGANRMYELLKSSMTKRGIHIPEWVDLNDDQRDAWGEFFWETLDLEH